MTSRFGAKDKPPIELLCSWIDESFRAIAPKSVVKELAAVSPARRDDEAGVAHVVRGRRIAEGRFDLLADLAKTQTESRKIGAKIKRH